MGLRASLLAVWALLLAAGCTHAANVTTEQPVAAAPLPPRQSFDPDQARKDVERALQAQAGDAVLAGARFTEQEAAYVESAKTTTLASAAHVFLLGNGAPTGAAAPALPGVDESSSDPSHAAKIEREAQLSIEAADVPGAAAAVLALVHTQSGWVARDERSTQPRPTATLLVRVPAAGFDAFLDAVSRLGTVKQRNVQAVDATLEHKDIEILVANLEAAQERYRNLLAQATDPAQVLAIERELERVRTELDRIKGRLDYLRDRVAFATVAVALYGPQPEPDVTTGAKPQIATAVRGVSLFDVRQGGTDTYFGAGLSLRFPQSMGEAARGFSLDIDVMRACCTAALAQNDWAYDVLSGFDLYSESLESGRRRWLNPYLGARLGVAQTLGKLDFAAGAMLGLEIVKTPVLSLDLQTRLLAFVGNPIGPHAGVAPNLGLELGF